MLTFRIAKQLLILGGTRQETRGSHGHRGVSSENAGNARMEGCASPGHINSGDWRIVSQGISENVYRDPTFTMAIRERETEREVFMLMIFQKVNQGSVDLAKWDP